MKFNETSSAEVWDRLIRGKPLDELDLATNGGRTDLSGIESPPPTTSRRFSFRGFRTKELSRVPQIRGVKWTDLDFSHGKLNGLRIQGCEMVNCRFDGCSARDWRVWATSFTACSFRRIDLRNSMLGGVENGERCVYSGSDFSEADLRDTSYAAAGFERCTFRDTRLEKIDFQSSTFVDCVFEGELRDVLFYRHGYEGEAFPENEMTNVDFSRAKLHFVGFRGLTLDRVKFPADADHVVIAGDVSATLDRLTSALQREGGPTAAKVTAFLNIGRKWVVPNQAQKVINKQDLAETAGPEALDLLLRLLRD